ncbi:hypothetical protein ACP70R_032855 [Stipagrostis hirtigluma subsp. patula]
MECCPNPYGTKRETPKDNHPSSQHRHGQDFSPPPGHRRRPVGRRVPPWPPHRLGPRGVPRGGVRASRSRLLHASLPGPSGEVDGGAAPPPRLSFRYGVPQLVHRRQDAAEETAVLRLRGHGRHVIFYVQFDPRPHTYWVCVDALAAAPLLSGGLDGTARALRRDARLAALWGALWSGLCRRALVDLCGRNGVALGPSLVSLPDDVIAAILARLANGGAGGLASVEGTCARLRRLVAERDGELWKPRYGGLCAVFPFAADDDSPAISWKERFVRVNRRIALLSPHAWLRAIVKFRSTLPKRKTDRSSDSIAPIRSVDQPEPPAEPVIDRRKPKAVTKGKRPARRGLAPLSGGRELRRHGAGAIHSPSSRFRWKHR